MFHGGKGFGFLRFSLSICLIVRKQVWKVSNWVFLIHLLSHLWIPERLLSKTLLFSLLIFSELFQKRGVVLVLVIVRRLSRTP